MKVLVQWARASPRDWEELEAPQWTRLTSKPDLTGQPPGHALDDAPGHIAAFNVQGVVFFSDHYHHTLRGVYRAGLSQFYIDGAKQGSDGSPAAVPSALTRIQIGGRPTSGNNVNSLVSKVRIE